MMPGCQICCATELCAEGRRLRDAFDACFAAGIASTATTGDRIRMHRARADWHEHLYGSWEDEPEPLTADEQWRLMQNLRLVKRGPDIAARRAGMHQS